MTVVAGPRYGQISSPNYRGSQRVALPQQASLSGRIDHFVKTQESIKNPRIQFKGRDQAIIQEDLGAVGRKLETLAKDLFEEGKKELTQAVREERNRLAREIHEYTQRQLDLEEELEEAKQEGGS